MNEICYAACSCYNRDKGHLIILPAKVSSHIGFVPIGELYLGTDKPHDNDILRLIGKSFQFVEIGKDEKGVSLYSRKPIIEAKVKEYFEKYEKGEIVEGEVYSSSKDALYLELSPGVTAILYKSELVTTKLDNPTDVFKIGDKIQCKIIAYKEEKCHFEVSYRRLFSDDKIVFGEGSTVECTVYSKKIDDEGNLCGYYVALTPSIAGLLIDTTREYLPGEKINATIMNPKPKYIRVKDLSCAA